MYKHEFLRGAKLYTEAGAVKFDEKGIAKDIPDGAEKVLEHLKDVKHVVTKEKPVVKKEPVSEVKEEPKPVVNNKSKAKAETKKTTKSATAKKVAKKSTNKK